LEKIRAKREMMIKKEDPDHASSDHNDDNRSGSNNQCSNISRDDVKPLLAEYVS